MRAPHLIAAALALLLFISGGVAARDIEDSIINSLAYNWRDLDHFAMSFQRAAFRRPDLLPIYGSSEINWKRDGHAENIFKTYPTGFTVFPISLLSNSPFNYMQELAGIGADLRGKKFAISITPDDFQAPYATVDSFQAKYWAPNVYELAFNPSLRLETRRDAARLLTGRDVYAQVISDPFLWFTLNRLADDSLPSRLIYFALWPLGEARIVLYRVQDHWHVLNVLWDKRASLTNPPLHQTEPIPWGTLYKKYRSEANNRGKDNPFNFDRDLWALHGAELMARQGTMTDEQFLNQQASAQSWEALRLTLELAKDMGAQPLLIMAPLSAAYSDFTGVSEQARQVLYQRVRDLAAAEHVQFVDFTPFETDKGFTIDAISHPSNKGWMYYNRALDLFFHDQPVDKAYNLSKEP